MVTDPVPPDLTELLVALIISAVSGFISIAQRIGGGRKPTPLWVSSEFLASILCGYLMYDGYFALSAAYLPEWISRPLAIAMAAHLGGRAFQTVDSLWSSKCKEFFGTLKQSNNAKE